MKPDIHKEQRESNPLVSCIMPTRGRPHFVAQAIEYFVRQSYPNTELIIVADSIKDLPEHLTTDEKRIRIAILNRHKSIGYKRNHACRMARGSIIVHWDDDDWYSPLRIEKQVWPILHDCADITGLFGNLILSLDDRTAWKISADLHAKMFVCNVAGGTLAFKKQLWENSKGYPNTSLREDADFLIQVINNGARLARIDGSELFVYIRHQNTWSFQVGSFIDSSQWRKVAIPEMIQKDLSFYFQATVETPQKPKNQLPKIQHGLVSCIMPTYNRPKMVKKAIRQFQAQEYPNKELIIVDDGASNLEDFISSEHIHYFKTPKMSIGAKRNFACQRANGEVIMHWDDDDWYAHNWIDVQYRLLIENQADVCGLKEVFFAAPSEEKAWIYKYPLASKSWVHGATLCFTRHFWSSNKFQDLDIGEDIRFIWTKKHHKIVVNPHSELYVGHVHEKNVSPKHVGSRCWYPIPIAFVHSISRHYFQDMKHFSTV